MKLFSLYAFNQFLKKLESRYLIYILEPTFRDELFYSALTCYMLMYTVYVK